MENKYNLNLPNVMKWIAKEDAANAASKAAAEQERQARCDARKAELARIEKEVGLKVQSTDDMNFEAFRPPPTTSSEALRYFLIVERRLSDFAIFARTELDAPNQVILSRLQKWITSDELLEKYPMVMLCGPTGTGKTALAFAAAQFYADWRKTPTILSETQWRHDWLEACYRRNEEDESPAEILDRGMEDSLLVIDDLGKAKTTDAWFDALIAVIDHRTRHNSPILTTSNFSPEQLAQRYDPSMISRLTCGGIIQVGGADRRQVRTAL